MNGLLLKEYHTLKRYIMSYGFAFLLFLVLSIYMRSAVYLQSMLTMSLGMLAFTGMTYDKMYGWEKLVLTMPVKRSSVVASKYIASVIMAVVALVISTGIGMLMTQIFSTVEESVEEMAVVGIVLFGMILFVYAIVLPLIYKLGVERARIYMIAVVMIPFFLFLSLAEYVPMTLLQFVEEHIVVTGVLLVGVACVFYIASYCVSVKIYKGKEF